MNSEQSTSAEIESVVASVRRGDRKALESLFAGHRAYLRHVIGLRMDDDREIVLLQAFEGLNSTESAQVLGIEPAAARKRFGRALLRLRTLLIEGGLGGSQI